MTREELVRELELLMTKRDAATSFADSVNATNAVSRFANQHLAEIVAALRDDGKVDA